MKALKRTLGILLSMLILISAFSGISLTTAAETVQSEEELVDSSTIFGDVTPGSWYKSYVDYVVTQKYMNGMSDKKFEPNTYLTRAMFVQVLANLDGADTSNKYVSTKYDDVPSGRWYTGAVKWATDAGVVNGMSETEFAPMESVERQQMCTMLMRYAQFKGKELEKVREKKDFADDNMIKPYAKEAVYYCQTAGIVDGMTETTFEPRSFARRSQIAAILYRFCTASGFDSDLPENPDNPDNPDTPDIPETPDNPDNPENPDNPDIPGGDKYDFDKNLLINKDGQANRAVLPSFDIDGTDFVREVTKLSDLRNKTLAFFTADNHAMWSYRNEKGITMDEWEWFILLKRELGIQVKFTKSQHQKSVESALQAMNAGKQCDIIYSNHVVFPSSLCISRSLDDFINVDKISNSPGVCSNIMNMVRWGEGNRVISPIGNVDVLWYNQTLTQELGLSDPHKLWEEGKWNWNSFKDYLNSVPERNPSGEELVALVQWPTTAAAIWPSTNGDPAICLDSSASIPMILNNWSAPSTVEAWEFITNVCNNVNYDSSAEPSPGNQQAHLGLYNGTTMMSSTMYPQIYRDTEYSKKIQINWVPYPKSLNANGRDIAQWRGAAMMLPKRTSKPDNIPIALKFMELWASRFTESIFDNLYLFEYYNFNYAQRKQYFDFVTQNTVFGLPMNDFTGSNLNTDTNFFKCFTGDSRYNVAEEADRAKNIVMMYIMDSMRFGQ